MLLRLVVVGMWLSHGLLIAGDWIIPWVANKDNEWQSELVFNNLSSETLTAQLTAVRVGGESVSSSVEIPPFSQVARSASDVIPFNSGAGYTIFISTSGEAFSAAVRVGSTQTTTGFSPAMGSAVNLEHASLGLVFPTMPSDGFSAPAFINVSNEEAHVQVSAFGPNGQIGEPQSISIPARQPWVTVVTSLFPEITEGAYLVTSSDQPLVGANFSFNSSLEPSMINAVVDNQIDMSDLTPLLTSMSTTAALASAYQSSTVDLYSKTLPKKACPDITTDIRLGQTENFISARIDWGTGCTNGAGVYLAGAVSLNLSRDGGLSSGWMSGALTFDDFATRYGEASLDVNGTAVFGASTVSQNFNLDAVLAFQADSPVYGPASSLTLDTQLTGSVSNALLFLSGNLNMTVDTSYHYVISARVSSSDPLTYDYLTCSWPTDGRIDFTVNHSGLTASGYLDFGTGSCNTATLSILGKTETVDLTTIY